jgi:hypothetical protein
LEEVDAEKALPHKAWSDLIAHSSVALILAVAAIAAVEMPREADSPNGNTGESQATAEIEPAYLPAVPRHGEQKA